MKKLIIDGIFFTVAIFFLMAGVSISQAKDSIKALTSQNNSEEEKEEAPQISPKLSAIMPGGLQRHSIGLGLGQTFLLGDFRDTADDSITFDLLYGYSASYSFDMFANLHYSNHEFRKKDVTLQGAVVGIKGRLYSFDSFSPFAVAGLGFYSPTTKREIDAAGTLRTSDSKLTFGIHFGGGADLRLNDHYSIGVLAQYHDPFDVKQEIGPKVRGSYFKLLITGYYTY